ncbi:MAG TPA: acetate--CoA ligase family protein [Streptosporangiaceae bacterium]|nr:acetate--CoA ligase family protein [Streptosporangiaceae bacterium]
MPNPPDQSGQHGQPDLRAANYLASRGLVTPQRLREFFAPKSIAMVGASDNSGWARLIIQSSATAGFTGPLMAVHPKARSAFGLPVVPSLRDLPEPADLAFLLAPVHAVESVLGDMGAAGIRNAVVLASGYREVGAEGLALEDSMVARAITSNVTVLGPNCLGFVNAHTRSAPYALTLPDPLTAGPVGVALQSGALASVVLTFAKAHGIGLSVLTSMGNECMMKTVDVLDYLVEDEATRVVCLFLEEIGDPARFAQVAEKADRAGKPIVALKVGSSPAGQQAALAHTGSVVGDDAVVDAALRQLNIIRVTSIEELLTTGAMLGYDRWPRGRRMGVLTASGGACDIIADTASAQGLEIPEFSPETIEAITPHMPPFAAAHNPLDVTAFGTLANLSARTGQLTALDHALDIAVDDPNLDFILFSGVNLPEVRPPDETMAATLEGRLAWLAQRMASAPIPVIPVGSTCVDVSPYGRRLLTEHGLNVLGGLNEGITALGHALRWLDNRGRVRSAVGAPAAAPAGQAVTATGPWSEAAARQLLESAGVPVVPGGLAGSADEAVEIARRVGLPVALKICSAQITHKSDIGGVVLGLSTEDDVRAGYEKVRAAGDAVTGASIDGVLVTPMRSGGAELLAGVTIDPTFGPVLAVGLGGIWVEILQDTSLRVLPVDTAEVKRMLGELRGLPLLQGARGTQAANLDAVAAAIAGLGHTALSLNGALRAMEVNPLYVNGDQVEALDVLVVTES